MGRGGLISGLLALVAQKWVVIGHCWSLTKGPKTVNLSADFRRASIPDQCNETKGCCLLSPRDERDHPRGRFFDHVVEAPGGATRRSVWKRCAAPDCDGDEAVRGIVWRSIRQDRGNSLAKCSA